MGELTESFKEQGRRIREEIEELRKEFRDQEKRWKEEREELKKEKEKVEKRFKKLKEKVKGRKEEKKGEIRNRREEVEKRMRVVEREEKKERRRNIVIRGLEIREGGRREETEKLLEKIGVKAKAIEVKRIGGDVEKGREMVLLNLDGAMEIGKRGAKVGGDGEEEEFEA